jgi:hypothetical protein
MLRVSVFYKKINVLNWEEILGNLFSFVVSSNMKKNGSRTG